MARVKEKCRRSRSLSGLRFRKEEARGPHPIVPMPEGRRKGQGHVTPVGNNHDIQCKRIVTGIKGG
uniref:Uncharacterized protein n=1 Tax=Brassica oleracea var. oleracea TaxID=109376 RepID=A0A0D3A070_BRAOL